MVISHAHKFIFMHSRKCAGSTTEVMLNKHLGPDDIQIGSWVETINAGGKVNRRAVIDTALSPSGWHVLAKAIASCSLRRKKLVYSEVLNASIKKKYTTYFGPNASCPTAASVMNFNPEIWREYFKFAFVRNPFDFEVSDYFWRIKRLKKPLGFREFLKRKLDKCVDDPEKVVPFPVTNWPIYTISNSIAVDYVARFEDLKSEVKTIGDCVGLALDIDSVPKAKGEYRKNVSVEDLYDDESKEIVELMHKEEIDHFGYAFPSR